MQYFWTAREHIPDDIGFSLFRLPHLLFLVCILCGILYISQYFRHTTESRRQTLLKRITWLCLGMELAKDLALLITEQFRAAYLPLELCGVSIFLEFVAVRRPHPFLLELLYSLSLPGACLALIFPSWNRLPLWNYFCLHGFIQHSLLVLVPILLILSGKLHPRAKRLPLCIICAAIFCIPIAGINRWLGTNFFFLSRTANGLPLMWAESMFGTHLVGFPIIAALLWMGMYGIPALIRYRKKKKAHTFR